MSLRTVVALLVLVALAIFVAANWTAFTAPASLSLIVGTVEAPLGIVMLGITAAIAALFLAYAFYLHATTLSETRRMSRDVEAQRDLAERAEASRLNELRATLETRIDRLQEALGTLATQLRAIDDRLRGGSSPVALPAPAPRTERDAGSAPQVP